MTNEGVFELRKIKKSEIISNKEEKEIKKSLNELIEDYFKKGGEVEKVPVDKIVKKKFEDD